MNFRFTVVETSLNRAEFRWKWLRILERTFALGCILCVVALGFGAAILLGWITSKPLAVAFFSLVPVVGFIAWIVLILMTVAGGPARPWLAAAVERADRRMLDRLNTLLFLERRRGERHTESFALRIAKQVHGLLGQKVSPSPFRARRALGWAVCFLVALTSTILLYELAKPWKRLVVTAKPVPVQTPEKPLELAAPATNTVEQNPTWGEVRITDPGTDLKVTKVDVVALQIEAAANQALKTVNWYSTVNSQEESAHELPAPKEPRYAAYQPLLYLDEFQLSDWDVLTYYARAKTEKDNAFASEVYFLEVRPFREDLLKIPGGTGGKAYQCLNELTTLINRQQHVIRQTHQHVQQPPEQETLKAQDREKLVEAESDLEDSTQHLYAKMASEMENKPIGDALDNLAKAEKSLARSSKLLKDNVLNDAQSSERGALSELVAARKAFQKTVSEHPDQFDEPSDEDKPPVADSSKKLNEIAEFRNEAKAADQFVQKLLEQQRVVEQQVKALPRSEHPRLAEQERQVQQSLKDFEGQHPQVFKASKSETEQTQQAFVQATEDLKKADRNDATSTRKATEELRKLGNSIKGQSAGHELADAYKLKGMLDQQISIFDQRAKGDSAVAEETLDSTVSQARETINELKKVAEQEPTRDAFGQPLRDALNGDNKVDLDAKLGRLERARRAQDVQDEQSRQARAGEARDALAKVSQAFEQSEPKGTQMAKKVDSLRPSPEESLNLGMSELASLIKQLENQHQLPPADQAKQRQQALLNLQSGLRSVAGDNESQDQILLRLNEVLKADAPLQLEDLKKLMDQLQHFSVETSDRLTKREDTPEVSNIDPSRLPPAYRGRIQKYFQRLSEK